MTTGRDWKHTVLVISFDEWGGFFDHVTPEEAPDVNLPLRYADSGSLAGGVDVP